MKLRHAAVAVACPALAAAVLSVSAAPGAAASALQPASVARQAAAIQNLDRRTRCARLERHRTAASAAERKAGRRRCAQRGAKRLVTAPQSPEPVAAPPLANSTRRSNEGAVRPHSQPAAPQVKAQYIWSHGEAENDLGGRILIRKVIHLDTH